MELLTVELTNQIKIFSNDLNNQTKILPGQSQKSNRYFTRSVSRNKQVKQKNHTLDEKNLSTNTNTTKLSQIFLTHKTLRQILVK